MIYNQSDILAFEDLYRRNFVNSLTGFKSLVLIGTNSKEGSMNLAPFSQVIHVGANPPLIGILFRPHIVPRHTFENIIQTGHFTINHVHEKFIKEAHWTAARWETSEFSATGIKEDILENFPAPFVRQSKIKMGCKFLESYDIKANGTHFIVGEILMVLCESEVIGSDGFIDLEKAGTLTVSGLDSYHKTRKVARYQYPKPGNKVEEI